MKKGLGIAAVTLAMGLWMSLAAPPAFGQGSTWAGQSLAQVVEGAQWRWDALRINLSLGLGNVGYDNDIYSGYFADRVPDFTLSSSVPVQVILPLSRKVVLDVTDIPRYDFYVKTKNERAWNNTFRGKLHVALEKLYLQAGGSLADLRSRLSPEVTLNIRERTDNFGGLLLWQTSRSTSLALIGGVANREFSEAEYEGINFAEALNRKESAFDLITYFGLNERVRFFLDGRYGTYRFAAAASRYKDTDSYSLFGGLDFSSILRQEGEDLFSRTGEVRGSASLGFTRFDLRDPGQADGSGLTGNADVSVGIMKLTTARIHYIRTFQFSVYTGGTYFVHTSGGAGLSRFLSRTSSLGYDLSFGRSTYPGPAGEGGGTALIRDMTHTLLLEIRFTRRLIFDVRGLYSTIIWETAARTIRRAALSVSLVYGSGPATVRAPAGGLAF